MTPLFSIVCVTLNELDHDILLTLSSISSQSFCDYELIFIDGASDVSPQPLLKCFPHPRIQYISKPDNGIYDAMNRGVKASTGKWIVFLNVKDSFYQQDSLKQLASYITLYGISGGVLYCDAFVNNSIYKPPCPLSLYHFFSSGICHQSVVAHHSVFKNLPFNTNYKILADRAWLIRNLYAGTVFTYLPIVLSCWDHGGASSNLALKARETNCLRLREFNIIDLILFSLRSLLRNLLSRK